MNQQTQKFYSESVSGIHKYLLSQGLIHRDRKSQWTAQRLGLPVKGVYKITDVIDSPRILSVEIALSANHLDFFTTKRERLSMASLLPQERQVNIERVAGGKILLQIPKPDDLAYVIPLFSLPVQAESESISIGLDTKGSPIFFDFAKPTLAHLFISGMTGSGKTLLEKAIAVQLARQNKPNRFCLMVSDVGKQGASFQEFNSLDNMLFPVLTNLDDTKRGFLYLQGVMQSRMALSRADVLQQPRIVYLIDETQEIMQDEETAALVKEIAAKGREFRISLLLATQFTNNEYLGNNQAVKNMARIVGKVNNANEGFNMTGVKHSGAETLVGMGDFMLVSDGSTKRFQSALVTPSSLRRVTRNPKLDSIDNLPELDEIESGTDKRKTMITEEMIAEAFFDGTYRNLQEKFKITNTTAKRIRQSKDKLQDELGKRGMVVRKG